MDDETDWRKQILVGLVVLVAVGALIGGIVALVSIKAADLAGIGDTSSTASGHDGEPRPTDSDSTEPSDGPSSQAPTSSPPTSSKPPRDKGFVLAASPLSVATYERINLTGTYDGPPGATLQVQRKEGSSWVDFPTTARLNGQTFATYIETGHSGSNKLRMFDASSGEASNTVTVMVS